MSGSEETSKDIMVESDTSDSKYSKKSSNQLILDELIEFIPDIANDKKVYPASNHHTVLHWPV